jgi:hypothetical protein
MRHCSRFSQMVLRVSMVWVKSGDHDGLVTGYMVRGGKSVIIAMRVNLTTKCRVIPVPAPILVISRLVALNGRVFNLALSRAARGCARGQGNSPSVATSGWSGPGGLTNSHSFYFSAGVSRSNLASE